MSEESAPTQLTAQERIVLDTLAEAWNAFTELEVLGEWHKTEFMQAIHIAQRIVMVQPILRQEKDDSQ